MLPNITFMPIAPDLAVSETTLADTCALQRAPNENAPLVIKKVAPYRTCGLSEAKNIMYPAIIKGADTIKKICLRSKRQLKNGNRTVKNAPTIYGGTVRTCWKMVVLRG